MLFTEAKNYKPSQPDGPRFVSSVRGSVSFVPHFRFGCRSPLSCRVKSYSEFIVSTVLVIRKVLLQVIFFFTDIRRRIFYIIHTGLYQVIIL